MWHPEGTRRTHACVHTLMHTQTGTHAGTQSWRGRDLRPAPHLPLRAGDPTPRNAPPGTGAAGDAGKAGGLRPPEPRGPAWPSRSLWGRRGGLGWRPDRPQELGWGPRPGARISKSGSGTRRDPAASASSRALTDLDLHALEDPEPLFLHRHAGRNPRAEPRGAAGAGATAQYPRSAPYPALGGSRAPQSPGSAHWPCPAPHWPRPAEGRGSGGFFHTTTSTAHWPSPEEGRACLRRGYRRDWERGRLGGDQE